jgi:hypothetical protein
MRLSSIRHSQFFSFKSIYYNAESLILIQKLKLPCCIIDYNVQIIKQPPSVL